MKASNRLYVRTRSLSYIRTIASGSQ
jgi:hypothetical protein